MRDNSIKALEYTMGQLEKEWERSGRPHRSYELDIVELRDLYQVVSAEIFARVEAMKACDEISFKESLEVSHTNNILLRIARVAAKEISKAEKRNRVFGLLILDKEEAKLYEMLQKE